MFKKFFSLFLIAIILFSALFIAGCSSGESWNNEVGGFIGGTTGLRMGIVEGAPPSVLLDAGANPFSVIISLENIGEADVGPGTDNPLLMARITGIDYTNFGFSSGQAVQSINQNLDSAKRNYDGSEMPGAITYVNFDNLVYKPDVSTDVSLVIRAEICYDYESYATATFCMKSNIFNSWDDNGICTIRESKPVGNSGSPLHITRVEEAPINNNTVQIMFYIEHVGRGAFFQRSSYSSLSDVCLFSDANPNINKVEVFVEPVQDNSYSLDCPRLRTGLTGGGASGVVTLVRGAPLAITCSLSRTRPTSIQAYKDIINIRLRYRYGEYVEIPITIQSELFDNI
jgi:hypothetical protein